MVYMFYTGIDYSNLHIVFCGSPLGNRLALERRNVLTLFISGAVLVGIVYI